MAFRWLARFRHHEELVFSRFLDLRSLATGFFGGPSVASLFRVLFVFLTMFPSIVAAENVTLKVYSLLYDPGAPLLYNEAVNAGFSASMAVRNWSTASNVNVEVAFPQSYNMSPLVTARSALSDDEDELVVLVGPISDMDTLSLIPLLIEQNLVAFGPYAGSNAVRGWNPHLYFLSVSPNVELLALLRYSVSQLQLLRIGFMYLQNIFFGDSEYELAVELMAQMGRELCGVFTLKSSVSGEAPETEFEEVWNRFAETMPQGVIMFAPQTNDTTRFLKRMVADNRTKRAYMLSTTGSMLDMEAAWRWASDFSGAQMFPGQIVFSSVNPLPKEEGWHATSRLRADLSSYEKSKFKPVKFNSSAFDNDGTYGELVMYGWIVGEVLAQALGSSEFLKDRNTFLESLYGQRRYVIDDIVIGDFGAECEAMAAERGAACRCNEGGHAVYIVNLGSDYRLYPAADGITMFRTCATKEFRMFAPVSVLMLYVAGDPVANRVNHQVHKGAHLLTGDGRLGQSDRLFLHSIESSTGYAVSDLQTYLNTRMVTAVFGVVDDELLSTPGVVFVDPVTRTPQLRHPHRNIIYLSPTLEQQLFVVSEYLVSANTSSLNAIIRCETPHEIEEVLHRTLVTFNISLNSSDVLSTRSELEGHLPTEGWLLFVGLAVEDLSVIANHLVTNPDLRVLIPFFDIVTLYDDIASEFSDRESAERLLFATNLPHWADTNSSSETVQRFHAAAPNQSEWTPLALLGFAAAGFINAITPRLVGVTPETLLDAIYTYSVASVGDVHYGPFADRDCSGSFPTSGSAAGDCVVNYGATRISLWSVSRALDASVPPIVGPTTPLLLYHDRDAINLSGGELAGVIAGSFFFLALVVALLLVFCFMRHCERDNDNAPKELMDPVTLILTDIENSTAQWAAHPELMPDAVAAHHRLIRLLISQYGCYEVKTIGDSFMIACKSPFAAVRLARDLQRRFLCHKWETTAFDESYREFERQKAMDDAQFAPPTAHLDPELYQHQWSGLRVRIGIHTGLCDIRRDEVTKGYDYYGGTSLLAGQTESIANGGQVLLTGAVYFSLSSAERELFDVTALGSVALSAVPAPVEIYQLEAVPGRSFATLRLDRRLEATIAGGTGSSSDTGSMAIELSREAQRIAISLESMLTAFTPAKRQKALIAFCERWRVSLPQNDVTSWNDAFCRDVEHRIAVKAGRVASFEQRNTTGSTTTNMGRSSVFSVHIFRTDSTGSQLPLPSFRADDSVNRLPCRELLLRGSRDSVQDASSTVNIITPKWVSHVV